MLRVMWFAAALACSGTSPPPAQPTPPVAAPADAAVDAPPLDQDLPRLAERSLAMYRDVGQALGSSQDCPAAIAKLRALAAGYRDVVTANAKVLHDGRVKELRAALAPHGDEFDRLAQQIVQSPTMSRCAQDAAFMQAFDEMLEPP